MIEILKELLDVRLRLERIESMVEAYGYLDSLQPRFREMQDSERFISQQINDWSRPDPLEITQGAANPVRHETQEG